MKAVYIFGILSICGLLSANIILLQEQNRYKRKQIQQKAMDLAIDIETSVRFNHANLLLDILIEEQKKNK